MPEPLLVVSFGGGVNSTAMLLGFKERGVRHWSWEDLVNSDKQQLRMFGDDQAPMCDTCVDW